jgi:DNA-binding MarR family transcriptional regulator
MLTALRAHRDRVEGRTVTTQPLSRHDRDQLHVLAWHHRQRPGRWVVGVRFAESSVMARVLRSLVERRLVERRIAPGDVVMLRITAAGLEALVHA